MYSCIQAQGTYATTVWQNPDAHAIIFLASLPTARLTHQRNAIDTHLFPRLLIWTCLRRSHYTALPVYPSWGNIRPSCKSFAFILFAPAAASAFHAYYEYDIYLAGFSPHHFLSLSSYLPVTDKQLQQPNPCSFCYFPDFSQPPFWSSGNIPCSTWFHPTYSSA